MAYLTDEAEGAFKGAALALESGNSGAATVKETTVYSSQAIVMALKGVCLELAALREVLESREDALEHSAAE